MAHQRRATAANVGEFALEFKPASRPLRRTRNFNAVWYVPGGSLFIDYDQGYAIDEFPLSGSHQDPWVGVPARTRSCPTVQMRPYP